MSTLVLAESSNGRLLDAGKRLVSAARAFAAPLHVLVVDTGQQVIAAQAAQLAGVEQVFAAPYDEPDLVAFDEIAALLLPLAGQYQTILAAHSGAGKTVLPLLAARLGIAPVTGISKIKGPCSFERPVYAGSLSEVVETTENARTLATIRVAGFPLAQTQSPCPVETLTQSPPVGRVVLSAPPSPPTQRPDLADAKIVIAGGRGLGSLENFAQLEPLADALGAALGASRIAVDMGWSPHTSQIGQTGVQIAPDLYIAFGISGAVQHVAGIREAGKIVAINKDPEAPIFKAADYGMVADLSDVLPALKNRLTNGD